MGESELKEEEKKERKKEEEKNGSRWPNIAGGIKTEPWFPVV